MLNPTNSLTHSLTHSPTQTVVTSHTPGEETTIYCAYQNLISLTGTFGKVIGKSILDSRDIFICSSKRKCSIRQKALWVGRICFKTIWAQITERLLSSVVVVVVAVRTACTRRHNYKATSSAAVSAVPKQTLWLVSCHTWLIAPSARRLRPSATPRSPARLILLSVSI